MTGPCGPCTHVQRPTCSSGNGSPIGPRRPTPPCSHGPAQTGSSANTASTIAATRASSVSSSASGSQNTFRSTSCPTSLLLTPVWTSRSTRRTRLSSAAMYLSSWT